MPISYKNNLNLSSIITNQAYPDFYNDVDDDIASINSLSSDSDYSTQFN